MLHAVDVFSTLVLYDDNYENGELLKALTTWNYEILKLCNDKVFCNKFTQNFSCCINLIHYILIKARYKHIFSEDMK